MAQDFSAIEAEFGKHGNTAIFSTILVFVLFIALLCLPFFIHDQAYARTIDILVIILGSLCGWVLGILSSPYSSSEERRFGAIAQAMSAFLSGYALSKLDRFLETSLFDTSKAPLYDMWCRVGFFIGATAIFALLIYSNRAYFGVDKLDENKPKLAY